MKKLLVLAMGALLIPGMLAAATIDGSSHDLGTNDTTFGRVCIFCHVPHNGTPAVPLWNHSLTTATYSVYTSSTLNASLSGTWAAGSVSKLCMGCHDGTIGLGSVVHDTRLTVTNPGAISGDALLGTDLTNDHPVAFTYQTAIDDGDGELVDPFVPIAGVQLFNGTVECASCHDVHDPANTPFLVDTNTNSAMCFACHAK